MPLVGPGTIAAVAQALPQHTAVVAQHHGRRGHPVGFASGLYSELMSLVGEDGLRRLGPDDVLVPPDFSRGLGAQ